MKDDGVKDMKDEVYFAVSKHSLELGGFFEEFYDLEAILWRVHVHIIPVDN